MTSYYRLHALLGLRLIWKGRTDASHKAKFGLLDIVLLHVSLTEPLEIRVEFKNIENVFIDDESPQTLLSIFLLVVRDTLTILQIQRQIQSGGKVLRLLR